MESLDLEPLIERKLSALSRARSLDASHEKPGGDVAGASHLVA